MGKNVLPMNPMPDGSCRTIKAQYQQSSLANFIRPRGGYQTRLPQSEKTTSFWSRSAQHAKRVRTDEERLRRHLHGDKGAKFSSRKLVPGTNGIMGALTTVIEKDNLIVEIWQK